MPWSIEQLFRRNIETKLSQNVANGIHDKKEDHSVQSLRILESEQIPQKFGVSCHITVCKLYPLSRNYFVCFVQISGRYFTPQLVGS
jgi:hypothetical protein